MSKTDRTQATAENTTVGTLVFKGNGATLWRVIWLDSSRTLVSVCKSTTKVDPTYSITQRLADFRVATAPVEAAAAAQAAARPTARRSTIAERRAASAAASSEAYYQLYPYLRPKA